MMQRFVLITSKEAIAMGEWAADTDTHSTAQAILACIEGLALLGKAFNDPDFIRRLTRGVFKLVIVKEA